MYINIIKRLHTVRCQNKCTIKKLNNIKPLLISRNQDGLRFIARVVPSQYIPLFPLFCHLPKWLSP